MILLYMNTASDVKNILAGKKTIETRTYRAMQRISKAGLCPGQRIGFIYQRRVILTARVESAFSYLSAAAFYADLPLHCVDPEHEHKWQDKKGKAGIALSDVVKVDNGALLPRCQCTTSYRQLDGKALAIALGQA